MTPRRIEARELDPELHPDRDYSGLTWVHRVGRNEYRFPVHDVSRDRRGGLVITYGGKGPGDALAPRVAVDDHHRVLIEVEAEREAQLAGPDDEIEIGFE